MEKSASFRDWKARVDINIEVHVFVTERYPVRDIVEKGGVYIFPTILILLVRSLNKTTNDP